jgi:hypothetical protein
MRHLSMQGVFVKRHQITKEQDGSPFTPADLAVGETVTMYERTFFVVDADAFTRAWYTEHMGLELAGPGTYPADPLDAYRKHFGLDKTPSERQGQRLFPACLPRVSCKAHCLFVNVNQHTCHMLPAELPAAKKSNDLATFVEARLGKPSHLLEGDKLKQFLAQVGTSTQNKLSAQKHLHAGQQLSDDDPSAHA